MEKFGVSRLRGAWQNNIPKTADLIFLVPESTSLSDVPYAYVAVSSTKEQFHLITCAFTDNTSKVFVAKNVTSGIQTLKEEQLRYIVTGAVVKECAELAWVAPPAGYPNNGPPPPLSSALPSGSTFYPSASATSPSTSGGASPPAYTRNSKPRASVATR